MNEHHWKSAVLISSPMLLYRISQISKNNNFQLYYDSFFEEYTKNFIFKIWIDIQHEFIAIIARFILPNDVYNKLILKYKVNYYD